MGKIARFPPLLSLILTLSCSAEDPGIDGLTRPQGPPTDGSTPKDAAKSDSASDGGDASATNAFTGAPPYTSVVVSPTAKQKHTTAAVPVVPDKDAKCMTCHGGGGAPDFLFAGTLYTDDTATTPAADKEVRVLGADAKGYTAHSDADGNFWFKKGTDILATPAKTGARDLAVQQLMVGTITSPDCNNCHDGGGTKVVHM